MVFECSGKDTFLTEKYVPYMLGGSDEGRKLQKIVLRLITLCEETLKLILGQVAVL